MPALSERIEFAPPPPPGMVRALGWAIFAHVLLLLALTWGVSWKRQDTTTSFEAELWSAVPQAAAPRQVEPPPIPALPQPTPAPAIEPEKPAPAQREAEIAIEKEKQKKQQLEKELQDERKEKLKEEQLKKAADKKADDAAKKKAAEDAKKEALRQAQEEEQNAVQQREANLKRMAGLAGATGDDSAKGGAQQSSGPSSGYGGRIKAKVKPNVVFPSDTSSNPRVEIEVRMAPDGTLLGTPTVVKSSGNREWDDAIVRAFVKTEVLPRDVDGRVPSPLRIVWRAND